MRRMELSGCLSKEMVQGRSQYLQTRGGRLYEVVDLQVTGRCLLGTPLSKRAWTFQGRYLAQQTLHFTAEQIFVECGSSVPRETLASICCWSLDEEITLATVLEILDFESRELPEIHRNAIQGTFLVLGLQLWIYYLGTFHDQRCFCRFSQLVRACNRGPEHQFDPIWVRFIGPAPRRKHTAEMCFDDQQ